MLEKDITAKDHLRSQCIDPNNGVYAVSESNKNIAIPVPVIKKRSGGTHKTLCEEERSGVASEWLTR